MFLTHHIALFSFLCKRKTQHALDNKPKLVLAPEHDEPMGSWSSDKIRQCVTDSVMLTWAPGKAKYVM